MWVETTVIDYRIKCNNSESVSMPSRFYGITRVRYSNSRNSLHCVCFFLFHLQLSQTAWPAHAIHQNFYDLYIANRSYEKHYNDLFEKRSNSHQKRKLYEKITKHFLAVHVYVESIVALDIRDRPQLTTTSFLSQLGGTLNLWAGITVVVILELIEFCYEVVAAQFNKGSREEKTSTTDLQQT